MRFLILAAVGTPALLGLITAHGQESKQANDALYCQLKDDGMNVRIAALEAKLAKTRQVKQGMVQEILSGKTRLI